MFRRGVCHPGRRRRSPRNVRCGDCPDSCVRSAWTVWSRAEPRGGTHIVMHVVEIIVESRSVKRAACGGTVAAAILEAGARTVAGGTATNDDGSARPQPRQHACRHDRRPDEQAPRFCTLRAARCTLHALDCWEARARRRGCAAIWPLSLCAVLWTHAHTGPLRVRPCSLSWRLQASIAVLEARRRATDARTYGDVQRRQDRELRTPGPRHGMQVSCLRAFACGRGRR
jgi:hypothetical protein